MPKASVEQGSPYYFEEGEYAAILLSVKENHVEFTYKSHHKAVQNGKARVGDKGAFDNWLWEFKLLEGNRAGETITLTTDPKVELEGWSPARVAYEALLGQPLELGQDVDTDLVCGLRARVVIANLEPETRGDRTYYNSRVTDVLPAKDGDDSIDEPDSDEPPF
jgi:hypothetical protein